MARPRRPEVPGARAENRRLAVDGVKRCGGCRQIKAFDKFNTYYGKPRSYCRECQSAAYKAYATKDPEAHAALKRASKYRQRFNLNMDQVEALFASANYCCEACGIHRDDTYNTALVLDHDHSCCPTEKTCGKCVRGVLCTKCNVALGALNDSQVKVDNLANYLRESNGGTRRIQAA